MPFHRCLAALVASPSAARCLPLLLTLLSCHLVRAQCPSGWDPAVGVPGTNGTVFTSTLWDPDGPGPLTPRVVVGGLFTTAGGIAANRIAMWDPATNTWSALGSGMDNFVQCLAVLPSGELVAGGGFSTAGGVPARSIARWNGASWSAFGGVTEALNGYVNALAVLPGGALVAAGTFEFAGFSLIGRIGQWNGASWLPLGSGLNNHVHSLAVLPGGDLIAGGYFSVAGGVPADRIARWSGASWSALGAGTNGPVFALATLPSGDLAVGGWFQSAGGAPAANIARWTPGTGAWSTFGSGMGLEVSALTVLANGELVAGGRFTFALGGPANFVARWNGAAWVTVGAGPDSFVRTLTALPGGGFVAGGSLLAAGGAPASFLARACGTVSWAPIGTGCASIGGVPLVPTLNVVSLPQLGSPFTLAVGNLGSGVPYMVTGFSATVQPLQPLGLGFGALCTGWPTPDLIQPLVAVGGTSSWGLVVPNLPSLAGAQIWNQVVVIDTFSYASNAGVGELH